MYYLDTHQRYQNSSVLCTIAPDVGVSGDFSKEVDTLQENIASVFNQAGFKTQMLSY